MNLVERARVVAQQAADAERRDRDRARAQYVEMLRRHTDDEPRPNDPGLLVETCAVLAIPLEQFEKDAALVREYERLRSESTPEQERDLRDFCKQKSLEARQPQKPDPESHWKNKSRAAQIGGAHRLRILLDRRAAADKMRDEHEILRLLPADRDLCIDAEIPRSL
jgi:hypothetical protein